MSRQNVEIVRQFTEAFNRRDIDALNAVTLPDANFEGYEGLCQWAAHWWEGDRVAYVDIEQLVDVADAVVAAIVLEARSVAGGQAAERHHVGVVLEFHEGRISKWIPYPSRARALEAVGLRE